MFQTRLQAAPVKSIANSSKRATPRQSREVDTSSTSTGNLHPTMASTPARPTQERSMKLKPVKRVRIQETEKESTIGVQLTSLSAKANTKQLTQTPPKQLSTHTQSKTAAKPKPKSTLKSVSTQTPDPKVPSSLLPSGIARVTFREKQRRFQASRLNIRRRRYDPEYTPSPTPSSDRGYFNTEDTPSPTPPPSKRFKVNDRAWKEYELPQRLPVAGQAYAKSGVRDGAASGQAMFRKHGHRVEEEDKLDASDQEGEDIEGWSETDTCSASDTEGGPERGFQGRRLSTVPEEDEEQQGISGEMGQKGGTVDKLEEVEEIQPFSISQDIGAGNARLEQKQIDKKALLPPGWEDIVRQPRKNKKSKKRSDNINSKSFATSTSTASSSFQIFTKTNEGPFGENYFDKAGGGDVGFRIWRDEHV